MNNILTIFFKEIKDTIRDRRTLLSMIVLPMVLMPLFIVGMGKFVEYQEKKSAEEIVRIGIVNKGGAENLINFIKQSGKIEAIESDSFGEKELSEAVKSGNIDLGIIIPENFEELIYSKTPVQLKAIRKSTSGKSGNALSRINLAIANFNEEILKERFLEKGVDQKILSGVSILPEDVVSEEEAAGFGLGFLLPLFIVMWAVIGGQYTAIDASAGEKERKTLEALLLTPVSKINIVLGKFLAVALASLVSIIVSLSSLYYAISRFGIGGLSSQGQSSASSASLNISLDPKAIIVMLAVGALLAMMFSAVMLSVAIFAKSYKEAQSYIGPSYLIVILPVTVLNIIPNFKPALWAFLIPVINAFMLFREVLMGSYNWVHIIFTIISLVIFSLISLFIASIIYSKEEVLFR